MPSVAGSTSSAPSCRNKSATGSSVADVEGCGETPERNRTVVGRMEKHASDEIAGCGATCCLAYRWVKHQRLMRRKRGRYRSSVQDGERQIPGVMFSPAFFR